MRGFQISTGKKNTVPEIRSLSQTGEVNTIGLSLEENNVFWVDYRGKERLNRSAQVILLSRRLAINKKGQMGFV